MPRHGRCPELGQRGECGLEPLVLLGHQRVLGNVGCREVRVHRRELEVRAGEQLADHAGQVVMAKAEPVHAGVDLQVVSHAQPAPGRLALDGRPRRRGGDGRGEAVVEQAGQLADAQRAEDEDLGGHAAAPEHDRLLDVGAREHRRARALEGARHGDGAVAVGVRLDDGDDARRMAALTGWSAREEGGDGPVVRLDGREVHVGDSGADHADILDRRVAQGLQPCAPKAGLKSCPH